MYVRERLGISNRKAWALLKVEKATRRGDAFARAYGDGTLSWARALALVPVVARENAAAWVAHARAVTVRRLCDDVDAVLEAHDRSGVLLDPPPLDGEYIPSDADGPEEPEPSSVVADGHDSSPMAARESRCREMTPPMRLHIGAHRGAPEVCDVEIRFTGPASVVALFRDVLDAFAEGGAPRWAALEALLRHVIRYWEGLPRHRDPIFARDGRRCTVPGCSARRNLHDHDLVFRSCGGGNSRDTRTTICAAHHLHGVHAGTIRASGTAPDAIAWQLGVRPDAPPLLTCVGDRMV